MPVLKLQNEGETYTGLVHTCEAAKGNYGEQVRFDFIGGDTLYLPRESADRQLGRCGFTVEDGSVSYGEVEGNTLTFSRDHNPKPGAKPYWGISVATKADLKPKAASKRVPPPASGDLPNDPADAYAPPAEDYGREPGDEQGELTPAETEAEAIERRKHTGRQAAAKRYLALWDVVAEHQVAKGKALGMPVDGVSVNSACATLWIFFGNKGLVP